MEHAMSELVALIGLGNPGADYAQTRHNAGFWWIDALAGAARVSLRPESKFHSHAARATVFGRDVLLVQPQTFMNRSGQAVQAVAQFYKIEPGNLLIAHDELALPPAPRVSSSAAATPVTMDCATFTLHWARNTGACESASATRATRRRC